MHETTNGVPSEGPGGDRLDAGLRAAFGPRSTVGWGGESVLDVLERDCGISSHLLLGDGPDDASEMILPEEPGPDGSRRGIGRYLIAGELARGGVGVVLKGRDTDLGREVAVKVLRSEYADDPDGPPLRRGGPDRRPVAAPGRRAGLRAGARCRPAALLHHEAGPGPDPGRAARRPRRAGAGRAGGSSRSSSRSARRWPTRTPGA